MSDSKVFMIPDGIAGGNSVDPNLLLTSIMNNGGFGGNGNWIWIIFLFLLWGRNGYGFGGDGNGVLGTGYLSNQLNNTAGRDLLMQAINGNSNALQQLATTLSSDVNSIKSAINCVQASINSVGNQVGMSAAQVTNAITTGNMNLAQQLAQCCCDNKLLITQQGYQNQIATLNQTNALQQAIDQNTVNQQEGFTTINFQNQVQQSNTQRAIADGVQSLKDATVGQTSSILAKLDAMEDDRKNREINNLTAQLAASTARAERAAELTPIIKQLDAIQCKQPSTATVSYSPFTAVPNCIAWNAGLYGLGQFNNGGSIWS